MNRITRKMGALTLTLLTSAAFALPAGAPTSPRGPEVAPLTLGLTADSEILSHIHKANLAEIEFALLGLQKASSTDVKNYARMLLQDHQQGDQKLARLALDVRLSWAPSACPNRLQQERESKELFGLQQLINADGSEFDRAFLKLMIDAHQSVINELSAAHANETRVRSLILELLPTLRHHLEHAQNLLKTL